MNNLQIKPYRAFFLSLLLLIQFSCQKKDLSLITNSNSNFSNTLQVWLDYQKFSFRSNLVSNSSTNQHSSLRENHLNTNQLSSRYFAKDANVDLLKNNLDLDNVYKKRGKGKFDYALIPIKENLQIAKNLSTSSTLLLFCTMNKKGDIISANIIYYLPSNGVKRNSSDFKSFLNLYADGNSKNVSEDGIYNILSVTGKWISQMEFKKGVLYTNKIISNKKASNIIVTQSICIDWYLVTTYHYPDGSIDQTSVYIGTTCDDCGGDYMSLCPDGGGGSSGDNTTYQDYTEMTHYKDEESDFSAQETDNNGILSISSGDGVYQPIKFTWLADIQYHYWTVNGIVITAAIDYVDVYNTTADPLYSSFISSWGIAGNRTLTLFNHINNYTTLTGVSVLVNWSCIVNGIYRCVDGYSWSRQWDKYHSKVW